MSRSSTEICNLSGRELETLNTPINPRQCDGEEAALPGGVWALAHAHLSLTQSSSDTNSRKLSFLSLLFFPQAETLNIGKNV